MEIIAIEKKTLEAVEQAFERFTVRMDEVTMLAETVLFSA